MRRRLRSWLQNTGHPGRDIAQAPSFLQALPYRQLLTLLQGDEDAARQPALLKEPSQLRQELEHTKKSSPIKQRQGLAASSPNSARRRIQKSRAKPRTASVPRPTNPDYTCSLSSSTIPVPLDPLGQHKSQALEPEVPP